MEYFSPDNLDDAYRLLAQYGEDAVPIAGSTFFMGHREDLFDEVQVVINIKRLGLSYIELDDGGLTIGATTTLNEIFFSELCRQGAFRVFSETVAELHINEVKNVATIGGEVCIAGEVDMPVTLLAYDANVVIGGANGSRTMSMADFHRGYLNNALEIGEMVIEVQMPPPLVATGGGFAKFERTAADLPIVNVAVRIALDTDGTCKEARVAVGAATVTGIPRRSVSAEAALTGRQLDDQAIAEAAEASNDIECIDDFRATGELRSLWVRCGVEDALKRAVAQAQAGE